MTVVEGDIPTACVLDRRLIEAAYFRDSCRAPLRRRGTSVVDNSSASSATTPRG
jgi:hypothetical protein